METEKYNDSEDPCKNVFCRYFDKSFEQNCCGLTINNGPLLPTCTSYEDTPDSIIKQLIRDIDEDNNYFEYIDKIATIFPKNLIEQLEQLINGPVEDGDIISKADRVRLFYMGIAIRVCSKGEQGYTGAKYVGYSILKRLNKR